MFGYVLPSRDRLDERERERFRAVYCGLCHTLRERYGFAASLLLNYDFTLLAILLSSGDEEPCTVRRCAVHPCKGCRAQTSTPALEAAADRTVILSWWQLRDHIADHGFWSGLKYRFASLFLRGAYRSVKADMLQEVPSTWTGLTGEGVLIRVTRVASKCYLFPLTKTLTNREKP